MNTSESLQALRRANPRGRAGFEQSVDVAAATVHEQIAMSAIDLGVEAAAPMVRVRRRRRLVQVSAAGVSLAVAATVALFLTIGSTGGGPGVESATAAVKKAATVTAASAERSGTAVIRMTHDGQPWAIKTVRWSGEDLDITDDSPGGPSSGLPLRVVNGMMYGHDQCCEGWIELGPLSSIDPGSGTTPIEILAAVRKDVGGTTLRRIVAAMRDPTTTNRSDGATVYRGTVPAGEIATEAGYKEGQAIRVFPFGYVAHDAAADPASLLDTAVTVGAEGVIREIAVTWGTWTYTVTYSDLGMTPALAAPKNAQSLRSLRGIGSGVRG